MSSDTALQWVKSSYSGSEGGQCVEVATHPIAIHIRDSKTADADTPTPHITVAPSAWTAFLAW
ncbi:DUF397 domain-containing protein [Streptomyces sp. NPDC127020]|uniref:DUF397 domain-containing protein n=1 Tax=Streptomyces sp. NPDC127020 TaxID=3347109 RepID=UPI0036546505